MLARVWVRGCQGTRPKVATKSGGRQGETGQTERDDDGGLSFARVHFFCAAGGRAATACMQLQAAEER